MIIPVIAGGCSSVIITIFFWDCLRGLLRRAGLGTPSSVDLARDGDADALRRGFFNGEAFPRRMSTKVFRFAGTNILCNKRYLALLWVLSNKDYLPASVTKACLLTLQSLSSAFLDINWSCQSDGWLRRSCGIHKYKINRINLTNHVVVLQIEATSLYSWQNLKRQRLQAPRLVLVNGNGCLEYCSSACWQNSGMSITALTWSPMCSALKQTTYTLWMNSDLGLSVYLCAVRVLLILANLVCS